MVSDCVLFHLYFLIFLGVEAAAIWDVNVSHLNRFNIYIYN